MIQIKKLSLDDDYNNDLCFLLFEFRHELALLKKRKLNYSLSDAKTEVSEYLKSDYEIYIAVNSKIPIGYAILKMFDETVWLEQLYVVKLERRNSVATSLLEIANKRAGDYGKETAFIHVHPNNQKMIKFLAKNGYDVLNLIEVRKLYNREKIETSIKVGDNSFLY